MTGLSLYEIVFSTGSGAVDANTLRVELSTESLAALENINVTIQNAEVEISNDAGNPIPVSATQLDIDDLINTTDSVAIGDETNLVDLQQNDAVFGTTAFGFAMFGVRRDASGSPVSADGDAHPLVFNNDGELKVAADLTSSVADDAPDSGNPIKVGGRAIDGVLTAVADNDRVDMATDLYRRQWVNKSSNIAINTIAASVTTTAAEVLATPLAGRQSVTIQNNGNQDVFLVESGATPKTDGIRIPKQASATYDFGEDINIFLVADSGTQDVRLLEIA